MVSGMRNMMKSLIYEIRECIVVKKRPDGAVAIGSSSFFAVSLLYLCRILTNLWVKFGPLGGVLIFMSFFSCRARVLPARGTQPCRRVSWAFHL